MKISDLYKVASSKRVLKSDWKSEGVPFYRGREITTLSKFGYVENDLYITEEMYNDFTLNYGVPVANDIMVTAIGTIGNTYIVKSEDKFYFKDASVLWLKKEKEIDSNFTNYWFKSIHFTNQLDVGLGATVDTLTIGKVQSLKINVPSPSTQKKIVSKLDAIFSEIDKATAAAEANVKNAEALFQSYLTQVFEHGGEGWKETNLKDIAEYFNGLTYSPKSVSEEGTVVLRSSNVQSDKILLKDIVRVNSPIKEKLYVTSGDILMCSRNGSQRLVGKTATIGNLDERMTFGTFMMIIRSESNFFIEWFFKSDLFKRQIASGENTMINQITRYMLDDIVIPLPDIPTQKSISSKISKLYNTSQQLKLSYTKKIKELGLYRQSILKQAFNGELVKE